MFAHAMADLLWSPDQALDTPLAWIALALRAQARTKVREIRAMLGIPEPTAPMTKAGEVDRDAVAKKTRAAFARFQQKGNRNAKS